MNSQCQTAGGVRPLLVMGTRPEAIKMAPVVNACRRDPRVDPIVCFTGQHKEMLAQVADYFDITPDVDLKLMQPNQTLAGLTSRCLTELDACIVQRAPTHVVAQGDTTTVLAASLAAFYRRLPFVHVEAGLRTDDLFAPWPEEFNRRVASVSAALHCAPTQQAAQRLLDEGASAASVHVTGNTVIDALQWTIQRERANS
ncbi:MAG: UDP-N-acetylglucosamine 2-epimerase (non-hydrolyzing), partial [Planctomycetales bacterium]|nr:UDP-N-acetylglucosamine 2-epimerase (non-hydrolyzing) [Planctomycetales bacterium]